MIADRDDTDTRGMCDTCWIDYQAIRVKNAREIEAYDRLKEEEERQLTLKRNQQEARVLKIVLGVLGSLGLFLLVCFVSMFKECSRGCSPDMNRGLPDGWGMGLATPQSPSSGGETIYSCHANGTLLDVYGDGPYSTRSSVCSAAVHAGVIRLESGGRVQIAFPSIHSCSVAGTRAANGVYPYGMVPSDTCFDVVGAR